MWAMLLGGIVIGGLVLGIWLAESDATPKPTPIQGSGKPTGGADNGRLALRPTGEGYAGTVRGLPVRLRRQPAVLGGGYAVELAAPPLVLSRSPLALAKGASMTWDQLSRPGRRPLSLRNGVLYGRVGDSHFEKELMNLSALLHQAAQSTQGLLHGLGWPADTPWTRPDWGVLACVGIFQGRPLRVLLKDGRRVFELGHRLPLHPSFLLGVDVGATQRTGELVLDMVLGCRSPQAEDVLHLQGHTESLVSCLHPRPHWRLKGQHLQMPCRGTLEEDLADLRQGAETLAELER